MVTQRFKMSASTAALRSDFRDSTERFLAALESARARVHIISTSRSTEAQYLLHYAWRVAHEGLDPREVPAWPGVDYTWARVDTHGRTDVRASAVFARQLVLALDVVHRPAAPGSSNHTAGLAIDMDIEWDGTLTILDGGGRLIDIETPRTGAANERLWEVG